jgi:hypothetical protein
MSALEWAVELKTRSRPQHIGRGFNHPFMMFVHRIGMDERARRRHSRPAPEPAFILNRQ